MTQLESLQTVAAFGLFPDHIQDGVDQFRSLGVVSLGPIVSGTTLAENEVVRAKDLPKRAWSDRIHGARLQVDQNGPGHVFTTWNGRGEETD